MAIAGRCEVTVHGDEAELFVGIGRLGRRRRFPWSDITAVHEGPSNTRYPGGHDSAIRLEGQRRLTFGSGLNSERRYFVVQALRRRMKRAVPAPVRHYRS